MSEAVKVHIFVNGGQLVSLIPMKACTTFCKPSDRYVKQVKRLNPNHPSTATNVPGHWLRYYVSTRQLLTTSLKPDINIFATI